jgi:hypothetical protein
MKISKNMVIMASSVLALIAGVATTPAAFAHTQRYWAGWQEGGPMAYYDYFHGNPYDASCPTRADGSEHTSNFCAGYSDSYRIEWQYRAQLHEQQQVKQGVTQGSSVSIKGNNNRVVVNQQANTGVDQPISGYPVYGNDKSSSSGSQNPECRILCVGVSIR